MELERITLNSFNSAATLGPRCLSRPPAGSTLPIKQALAAGRWSETGVYRCLASGASGVSGYAERKSVSSDAKGCMGLGLGGAARQGGPGRKHTGSRYADS